MNGPSPAIESLVIRTGARLHFGLLDVRRPFGGLGVMIDAPATELRFSESTEFQASDCIESRANAITDRLCHGQSSPESLRLLIEATQTAPSHFGFGSGTQVSLAIAEGLCHWTGRSLNEYDLACQIADRGKRSAIGVHGYFHGGLIYETGDQTIGGLNQVEDRVTLPTDWQVVLLRPRVNVAAVHGTQEQQRFESLASPSPGQINQLRRMVREEILPAAKQFDFASFATAVTRYNHDSGMLFAESQGGPYNGPWVTAMIDRLYRLGVRGMGQSSWGPGVFAWCEDRDRAQHLARELEDDDTILQITSVRNQGRTCRINSGQSAN